MSEAGDLLGLEETVGKNFLKREWILVLIHSLCLSVFLSFLSCYHGPSCLQIGRKGQRIDVGPVRGCCYGDLFYK